MLPVQKLAKEVSLEYKVKSCGSYILYYDTKPSKLLSELIEKNILKRSSRMSTGGHTFGKDHPTHAWLLQEACYASLLSIHSNLRLELANEMPLPLDIFQSTNTVKRLAKNKGWNLRASKRLSSILEPKKVPQYMVLLQQCQWKSHVFKYHADGSIDWDVERENKLFSQTEEAYNALMRAIPWATKHLVGGKKGATFQNHMENGAIIRVRDLSLQHLFAIAVVCRFPLEMGSYTIAYHQLRSEGFSKNASAQLALMMKLNGHLWLPYNGDGHDFVSRHYLPDEVWEQAAKGEYSPHFTQNKTYEEAVNENKGGYLSFRLFLATCQNPTEKQVVAGKYSMTVGGGWQAKRYIDLKALKGVHDGANHA